MAGTMETIARRFHETYERLAPEHGYETREASAKPWEDVPVQNRGLMIEVVTELVREQTIDPGRRTYEAMAGERW